MEKENLIKKDVHGNRDFYNLIRGIANDLAKLMDSNNKEKIEIIIKHIERNFGGIEYQINIDNLKLGDTEKKLTTLKKYYQIIFQIKMINLITLVQYFCSKNNIIQLVKTKNLLI